MALDFTVRNVRKPGLLFLLMMLFQVASAQKPVIITETEKGWQKIGEVTASFQVEKDGIAVLGADRFKAVKLRATTARIQIYDVEVFYESGESEHLDVQSELKPGEETKEFALNPSKEGLKKVVFTYKSAASMDDDQAHIELYGLK